MAALLSRGFTQEEVRHWEMGGMEGTELLMAAPAPAAPPLAEPLAKASREAGTEGQTEAASSTSQGWSCLRATPAACCHCSRPAVVGDRCSSSLESPLQQADEKGSTQPARASLTLSLGGPWAGPSFLSTLELGLGLQWRRSGARPLSKCWLFFFADPVRVRTLLQWFVVLRASKEEGRNCSSLLEVPPCGGRAGAGSFLGR